MEFERWKGELLNIVQHISSIEYQEKSWFGQSTVISSPEELICQLLDDFRFEEFLEMHGKRLSKEQSLKAHVLLTSISTYSKSMGDNVDPSTVFCDSRWREIMGMAKDLYESMDVISKS